MIARLRASIGALPAAVLSMGLLMMWPGARANAADAVRPGATLPPYVGAYQPQTVDERGVWMMADEDERTLRDSKFVINDPALNAYLKKVLCRAVGADRCAGVRIYIERVPAFNASMMPNGTLQIWSGALLRLRNEAELAAVLGHEFAHFEQRHTLMGFKQRRGATDIAAWAGVLSGFGSPSAGAAMQGVQMSAIRSIFSFSRSQEREADMLGAQYLTAAHYDRRCFADIWSRIMDEADATAFGRKQRSHRYDRVAFFASHPTELERASYLRALTAADVDHGDMGEQEWAAAMRPWRASFLSDQLKLNDFGGTDYLLGELARGGWTEDLLFARAELYRLRGNPRDLATAAGFYREAIALDPAHAESFRGLGYALMRGQDADEGRKALRRYLELAPQALDAAIINTLIS